MHPQSLLSGRLVPSLILAAILCALLADELVKVGARAAQADVAPRAMSAPQFVAPRLVPTLVRQPYLQRVSASSVTIVWAALEPGAGEVRYQSAGGNTVVVQAVTTLYTSAQTGMAHDYYQHEATLTGLSAATTYAYEVFVGGVDATAVTDEFTTAPPTGIGTTSFVVFGDSGSGTASQKNLAKLIAAEFRTGQRDLAIHTGDIVYPKGSYQLFQDRFFAIYEEWLRRRPIFFALGNHEYYEASARPYLNLFVMPENGYNAQIPDHRERYYSFDYGPVHFISLDTNAFNGNLSRQQQLTWLVRDLEAPTQPWRIVFMHIPTYGSSYFTNLRTTLQPIFERYGVQLVLAGHEHDYARGAPWREPPTAYSPVMHVVSGGGGASLNQPTPGPWLVNWARAFHYLNVTVTDCAPSSSCELTLNAIGLDGLRFDTFTLPLRAQQQDAAPPQVTWDQPEAGAVRSGIATISAIVSDDQQIVKVDALIDGVLRFVDDVPPYEWTWDTTKDLNGERTLELRAIDVADRKSTRLNSSHSQISYAVFCLKK